MTIANTKQGTMTVVGAPRYEHRGVVITAYGNMHQQKIDPFPWQVGFYSSERQSEAKYTHFKENIFIPCTIILLISCCSMQFQTGEYFGAEVCAMDVIGDSFTDIVVISAPMYVDTDREGRVYVCRLTGLVNDSFIYLNESFFF